MNRAPLVKRTLVAAIGGIAALGLMTSTPLEESGRTVAATARPDGTVAIEHLRGREYLRAYADAVGIWTICDGLTRGVTRVSVETREGCARRLEAELLRHADTVLACVPELAAPERDHQRWAFVSLSYNIGSAATCRSTAARRVRAGDVRGACDAFGRWVKAGRPLRTLRGLLRRRAKEREICLTGLPGYPATTLTARLEAVR